MFIHQDALPVGSWQLQLQGSKRWTICEPSFNLSNYDHTNDLNKISSSSSSSVLKSSSLCYEVTVHEGDIIYYPPSYWHQTINIDDEVSIAISNTVIHDQNQLIQFIRNECDIKLPSNTMNDRDCYRQDVDADAADDGENNDNVCDDSKEKNESNKIGTKYGYQFPLSFCNLFRF
jgi:ribosomal protein L16 Arg81 hydroxylase